MPDQTSAGKRHYLKQIARLHAHRRGGGEGWGGDDALVLGGDHSVAAGSVSGVGDSIGARREDWSGLIDAHSTSTRRKPRLGQRARMPLARLLGWAGGAGNIFGYAPKMLAEKRC